MRYTVAKAKHAAAVKRYHAAILAGTTAEMETASDAVEAAFAELRATPDTRLLPLARALRTHAEAA